MVHGLETLERLNAEKTRRDIELKVKEKVPKRIELYPCLVRRYLNRPWGKKELLAEQIKK
jgi:hypothetical protein